MYYENGTRFKAICSNPLHGACELSRLRSAAARCQGAPVGFMIAWLARGPDVLTKEEHWDDETMKAIEADGAVLRRARAEYRDDADVARVASFEIGS